MRSLKWPVKWGVVVALTVTPLVSVLPATATVPDGDAQVSPGAVEGAGLRFLAPRNYALPERQFGDAAEADFDGDGDIDLALRVDTGIDIALNDGRGRFLTVTHATDFLAAEITVGDLNGDGAPDLVFSRFTTESFSIGLNLGDGKFRRPVNYPLNRDLDNDAAVVVADFDGDGDDDVVADRHLFLGDGTGRVTDGGEFGTKGADYLTAGDFDGDGRSDLAVTGYDRPVTVDIYRGGPAGLVPGASLPLDSTDSLLEGLVDGDVDGDGVPDLITVSDSRLSVFLGDGGGGFDPLPPAEIPGNVGALGTADFDRDGDLDVAVSGSDRGVAILVGAGDGRFQPGINVGGSGFGDLVTTQDLDTDGEPDLVTVEDFQTLRVTVNDGSTNVTDCTIIGTLDDDVLHGTPGPDVICGFSGYDTLYGASGDDVLIGGDLYRRVNSRFGDDELFGGSGDDQLFGGRGDDLLDGGAGSDVLNGRVGVDDCVASTQDALRNCE